MNPFTDSLLESIEDDRLIAWVSQWDYLEAFIIEVYRAGQVDRRGQGVFNRLKEELLAGYQDWRQGLEPHWRGRQAGGRPIEDDPFQELLSIESAADLVDNWQVMQLLPAAREALNSYLLAQIERDSGDNG